MLRGVREHLSYANVMATIAVGLALGGGAYAAVGGIPDSGGAFHGCVSRRTGVLRVVKGAASCREPRRHHGRLVDPGELAIAWSRQGPRGLPGAQGAPGQTGQPGQPGQPGAPGQAGSAVAYAHVLANGTLDAANSKNVVDLSAGECSEFAPSCSPSHGPGTFECLKLSVPVKTAVVSAGARDVKAGARVDVPAPAWAFGLSDGCPSGYTGALVFTFDTTTGNGMSASFYVLFD